MYKTPLLSFWTYDQPDVNMVYLQIKGCRQWLNKTYHTPVFNEVLNLNLYFYINATISK